MSNKVKEAKKCIGQQRILCCGLLRQNAFCETACLCLCVQRGDQYSTCLHFTFDIHAAAADLDLGADEVGTAQPGQRCCMWVVIARLKDDLLPESLGKILSGRLLCTRRTLNSASSKEDP